MITKLFSWILAWVFMLSPFVASAEYGIYYWTSQKYASKTIWFNTMIIQPYNIGLYENYTGKKICYLTVGEFDWTADELKTLWLDSSKVWFNETWNSFIMDMSSIKRQEYLIKEELKLKNMWCNWLFLDTIWQDWQQEWWIQIVKKMRENWKEAYIIPNNAHFIRYDILGYINAFMFENFWETKTTVWSEDALWLEEQMQEYQKLVKWTNVRLMAISYWNPFVTRNKAWAIKAWQLSLKYWFEQIYTNTYLTNIYWYVSVSNRSIKKLPWVK